MNSGLEFPGWHEGVSGMTEEATFAGVRCDAQWRRVTSSGTGDAEACLSGDARNSEKTGVRGRDRCMLARGFRRGEIAIASNVLGWGDICRFVVAPVPNLGSTNIVIGPRHGRESRNQWIRSGSGTSWTHTDAYTLNLRAASIRDRHLGYTVPGLTSSESGWSGGSGARLGDRIRLCQPKFGKVETTCLRPVGLECRGPGGFARANPARVNWDWKDDVPP
ncbi:hypothetical protein EDB87DRAFT_1574772 [Lactarius vividus]|nr:hypothetical protein EDB87DRAFT_1574772 [Lactarius vividus]